MRRVIVLIAVLFLCGIVYAHENWTVRNYEFRTPEVKVSVNLDPHNTLSVYYGENMEFLGSRYDFCAPR